MLKELFEKIGRDLDLPKGWDTKEMEWIFDINEEDIGKAINVTARFAQEKSEEIFWGKPRGSAGHPRKTFKKEGGNEEELERFITAANDNVYNQFNLLSGLTAKSDDAHTRRMNVDLVVLDGKNLIKEMVELKAKENRENPIHAMFQLVFYFFLFEAARRHIKGGKKKGTSIAEWSDYYYCRPGKRLKLTVLAPCDYYAEHGVEKNEFKRLREIAKNVSKCLRKEEKSHRTTLSFEKLPSEKSLLREDKP